MAIFGDEADGSDVLEPASELRRGFFIERQEFDTDAAAFWAIFAPAKSAQSGEVCERSLRGGKREAVG